VVVGVDAELEEWSDDDVSQAEDVGLIVSHWREVPASEKQMCQVLRPLGYETSLVAIRRANSIAMLFICLTLSAVIGLREQWRKGQLRVIVEKLYNLRSHTRRNVYIKRLIWPLTDFERCLRFFGRMPG